MSKTNYRRCVTLGVTGRYTETCFPAAVDKLLPGQRVDPDLYVAYGGLMQRFNQVTSRTRNASLARMYGLLAREVEADNFLFRRVRTTEEFREVVREAHKDDMKVIVDIKTANKDAHSLGLETYDWRRQHFTLTSTNVPAALRGVLTLGYIFPHLIQLSEPPRERFPFNNANIALVPSH